MEFICEDIAETCDYIAWAYEIVGNETKMNEFKNKAAAYCN